MKIKDNRKFWTVKYGILKENDLFRYCGVYYLKVLDTHNDICVSVDLINGCIIDTFCEDTEVDYISNAILIIPSDSKMEEYE